MATHKTPAIQRWLVRHPRFTFHFTPTYSSWLNLVERWFAELTTKWLRRGTHQSVRQLVASIRTWINNWNDDPNHSCGTRPPTRSSTASPTTVYELLTQDTQRGAARLDRTVAGDLQLADRLDARSCPSGSPWLRRRADQI